ncbi:RING-H2 finger protein ATL65 [Olea europaea subsp. europaea]|uniref:RING-H2 finger protein ATL65 n=1 Tax=Olea europaea subsp. europaea TaxID=158383 RepID=A0A8S0P9T3_OLEEU|nr:RING-H2 finger protein ATL65 [Olea europaea subsp. europaea]
MSTSIAEKPDSTPETQRENEEYEGEEEEEDELSWSSESEIGEALDFLDSRDDTEGGILDGGTFTLLHTWRPNVHGGLHSRPNTSSLLSLINPRSWPIALEPFPWRNGKEG